ncbi:hypothetical protein HNY73_010413 [Argiope bruennichi]|uniref:Uncharacterized protein n=1 Tax=Argiope bruennichi TaxID=94029 RepID=A0A8T0F396_ARGBR|nr:hypothetical protein HNY73_010413 [Argiope bruennichi]
MNGVGTLWAVVVWVMSGVGTLWAVVARVMSGVGTLWAVVARVMSGVGTLWVVVGAGNEWCRNLVAVVARVMSGVETCGPLWRGCNEWCRNWWCRFGVCGREQWLSILIDEGVQTGTSYFNFEKCDREPSQAHGFLDFKSAIHEEQHPKAVFTDSFWNLENNISKCY